MLYQISDKACHSKFINEYFAVTQHVSPD